MSKVFLILAAIPFRINSVHSHKGWIGLFKGLFSPPASWTTSLPSFFLSLLSPLYRRSRLVLHPRHIENLYIFSQHFTGCRSSTLPCWNYWGTSWLGIWLHLWYSRMGSWALFLCTVKTRKPADPLATASQKFGKGSQFQLYLVWYIYLALWYRKRVIWTKPSA